jgi:heme/copper-type cytochrome/quinol oxidase subunit 1
MSAFDLFYVVLVVLAVIAAFYSLTAGAKGSDTTKKVFLVLWLIGPPIFFFLEYWLRRDGLVASGDLERVKDMQQRGAQVWAGVAAALAAIYFKSEPPTSGEKGDDA